MKDLAKQFYETGLSRIGVADKLGVSEATARRLLESAGVKMRRGNHQKWLKNDPRRQNLRKLRSLPSGYAARNAALGAYKRVAKKRNLNWSLTDNQFFELVTQNCHYCGGPPSNVFSFLSRGLDSGDFHYNGLDRIDSAQGYHACNVVPCCIICNRAKSNLSVSDFLAWIGRIFEFQQQKKVAA